MGTTTPIRGLYKPARGEVDWDQQVNSNFDNLDATANTSYVNSGDASTLSSAKAYTDSAVAGAHAPVTSVAGKTGDVLLVEGDIANLTADLAAKAPLISPALTGTPTAPTATGTDNSTTLATTAFVHAAVSGISSPVTSVAGKTGAVILVEGDITNLTADLAAKAPLASPALTGTPTAPTATGTDNSTTIATTAFVQSAVANVTPPVTSVAGKTGAVILVESDIGNLVSDLAAKAPLASPSLTGTPTAPTPTAGDSSTNIATTAFVENALSGVGATGYPKVVASVLQKVENTGADPNVLTYTPPLVAGCYRLSISITASSGQPGGLTGWGWTVTWTDSYGAAQAPVNVAMSRTGAVPPILTGSGITSQTYSGILLIDTDASGTPIVIKMTATGGAANYKISAMVERLI